MKHANPFMCVAVSPGQAVGHDGFLSDVLQTRLFSACNFLNEHLFGLRRNLNFCSSCLFLRLQALLFQNLFLRPLRALSFLTPDFFRPHLLRTLLPLLNILDAVGQNATGHEAVVGLGAGLLAFDDKAGREMDELDAGCGLIHFLPSGTGRPDKRLSQIALFYAELFHSFQECFFFFRGNRHKGKSPEAVQNLSRIRHRMLGLNSGPFIGNIPCRRQR